jgi:hypothetical protein
MFRENWSLMMPTALDVKVISQKEAIRFSSKIRTTMMVDRFSLSMPSSAQREAEKQPLRSRLGLRAWITV